MEKFQPLQYPCCTGSLCCWEVLIYVVSVGPVLLQCSIFERKSARCLDLPSTRTRPKKSGALYAHVDSFGTTAMKCPHCLEFFHPQWGTTNSGYAGESDDNYAYYRPVSRLTCPTCIGPVIYLKKLQGYAGSGSKHEIENLMVYPKGALRPPAPPERTPGHQRIRRPR